MLRVVTYVGRALRVRAVCTTVKRPFGRDAMADNETATMLTYGSQLVNRALESVKDMPPARRVHLETQLVFIAADFTLCHRVLLALGVGRQPRMQGSGTGGASPFFNRKIGSVGGMKVCSHNGLNLKSSLEQGQKRIYSSHAPNLPVKRSCTAT